MWGLCPNWSCNCSSTNKWTSSVASDDALCDFSVYFYSQSIKRTSWPSGKLCKKVLGSVLIHIFRVCVMYTATRKTVQISRQPIRGSALSCRGSNCLATTESAGSSLKTSLVTHVVDSIAEILLTVRVIFRPNKFAVRIIGLCLKELKRFI